MTNAERNSLAGTIRRKPALPRWLMLLFSVIVWPLLVTLFHGVLPWAISRMGRRFGWMDQHPGLWNWLGLICVALGSIVVLWFWFVHVREVSAREAMELKFTPDYLLTNGPYRYSRNPAYLAFLVVWFGWAVWYGSFPVLVNLSFFWVILNFFVIPREERGLEACHKEHYRQYLQKAPRWF
jgi:protein-S-isoprenylcysteine O-methyltransferase Ste14